MASALYQRREQFFTNSPTQPAPVARTAAQASDSKPQVNGEHNGTSKEHPRPQSPNGVSNYGVPNTSKKYSATNVKELHGTVGFANIPNQVFRKAVKQGFEFSLMVVGQSGLGKSTFVNSLFLTDFYNSKSSQPRKTPSGSGKTLQINETAVRLVENGVGLTLTLVDTPGFGDAVDNSQCWDPIISYVDRKFSDYFTEETKIYRKDRIPDSRAHCCLYFIPPTGHGLKQLDIEFMKHLHDRVNIIPVIAKADTMTPEECAAFKETIAKEIAENKIKTYQFPVIDDGDESKENKMCKFQTRLPFAVVGSNIVCDVGGKKVRCRKYPWGTVEVENMEHNDFIALRNMLIRTHIIDLIDVTRFVHYENFRVRQLVSATNNVNGAAPLTKSPFTEMEEKRREFEDHMKQEDLKREQIFQEKLTEKQEKLKQAEREVERHVEQMKQAIEQKRRELELKRGPFVQERLTFKQQHPDFSKYYSSTSLTMSDGSAEDKSGKKWKTGTLGSVFRTHHKQADD